MNILILLSCSLHSRGPHDDCKPTGATSAPHSTCPDFGKTSDEDYMTVANLLVPASDLPFSGTTAWTRAGEVLNWRSSPLHWQLRRRYGQFLCEHLIMPLVSSKTYFLGLTRESYHTSNPSWELKPIKQTGVYREGLLTRDWKSYFKSLVRSRNHITNRCV